MESVGVSAGGFAALIFQGFIRRCAPMGYAQLIDTACSRAFLKRAAPANIYVYGVGAGAPSLGLRRSTARSAHFIMGLCPYTPRTKKTAPSSGFLLVFSPKSKPINNKAEKPNKYKQKYIHTEITTKVVKLLRYFFLNFRKSSTTNQATFVNI